MNTLHTFEFGGSAGMVKMQEIMADFQRGAESFGGQKVVRMLDYSKGLDGLPASDVLKFYTETGSIVIRPSGTEPKMKAYISVTAKNRAEAEQIEAVIAKELAAKIK
jgi:phosphoglucomutase